MSQAHVSIPLDEFKKTEALMEQLNKRNAELMAELDAARAADPEDRVVGLNKLARALIETLSFATANLSPRDIKRWPHLKVREIAESMHNLADFSPHDVEHAQWLLTFADECEEWEKKRAATPEKEIPPPFPIEQHPMAQMAQGRLVPRGLEDNPGAEIKTDPSA